MGKEKSERMNKEINQILAEYELREPSAIKSLDHKNKTLFVEKNGRKYVLKRISLKPHEKIKLEKTIQQQKLLNYLKRQGFPYQIPEPLKEKNRKRTIVKNKSAYWIYEYIPGEEHRKRWTQKELKQIARMVSLLHELNSKPYAPTIGSMREVRMLKTIVSELLEMNQLPRKYKNKCISLIKKTNRKELKKLPKTIAHFDLHREHLLFQEGKLTGIIDFERIKRVPRVYDLGVFSRYEFLKNENKDWEGLKYFLEEYDRNAGLSPEEKRLFADSLVICFLHRIRDLCQKEKNTRDELKKCIETADKCLTNKTWIREEICPK